MSADEILRKYEDGNEYHLHESDRKWVIEAMEEYAALRQPPVSKCNWFEQLPLHWRYIYYMVGGILIGYLLHYVC
jgi:hypothetical protein